MRGGACGVDEWGEGEGGIKIWEEEKGWGGWVRGKGEG